MIIVTGGAGFIGSNLVKGLNQIGRNDILVVDDLTDGYKFKNLVDCKILDYQDKEDFLNRIKEKNSFAEKIDVVFHQGACSDTTEWNGCYMMKNNYEYSKSLFHYCQEKSIPFIYASSGAVYGNCKDFREIPENEKPLNVYGYSKLLFDQYVRKFLSNPSSQIVGLRYFNVYGPNEAHKGKMASVMFHFYRQLQKEGKIKLFVGSDGYADGEQLRDFVFVEDIVKVNLWFWQNSKCSGIYNVGTGKAKSFNAVGKQIISFQGKGSLEYIPFPENLSKSYQSFTEANIDSLRKIGCNVEFHDIDYGIKNYLTNFSD
jgi:ADP-L-glycero-D-manno-heptose 6-epimerase